MYGDVSTPTMDRRPLGENRNSKNVIIDIPQHRNSCPRLHAYAPTLPAGKTRCAPRTALALGQCPDQAYRTGNEQEAGEATPPRPHERMDVENIVPTVKTLRPFQSREDIDTHHQRAFFEDRTRRGGLGSIPSAVSRDVRDKLARWRMLYNQPPLALSQSPYTTDAGTFNSSGSNTSFSPNRATAPRKAAVSPAPDAVFPTYDDPDRWRCVSCLAANGPGLSCKSRHRLCWICGSERYQRHGGEAIGTLHGRRQRARLQPMMASLPLSTSSGRGALSGEKEGVSDRTVSPELERRCGFQTRRRMSHAWGASFAGGPSSNEGGSIITGGSQVGGRQRESSRRTQGRVDVQSASEPPPRSLRTGGGAQGAVDVAGGGSDGRELLRLRRRAAASRRGSREEGGRYTVERPSVGLSRGGLSALRVGVGGGLRSTGGVPSTAACESGGEGAGPVDEAEHRRSFFDAGGDCGRSGSDCCTELKDRPRREVRHSSATGRVASGEQAIPLCEAGLELYRHGRGERAAEALACMGGRPVCWEDGGVWWFHPFEGHSSPPCEDAPPPSSADGANR